MSPLYLHNSSPVIEILSRQSNHLPLQVALMPLLVPIIVSQRLYMSCPLHAHLYTRDSESVDEQGDTVLIDRAPLQI
jgi:hypothetical protein